MSAPGTIDVCMRHEPQSRRFVNTLGDGRVILKLQSTCDAIDDAQVVWRSGSAEREETLQRLGSVNGNEFFSVTIVPNGPAEYIFHVRACGQPRWLTPQGLEFDSSKPRTWFRYDAGQQAPFETPAWVRDAVFYQIFPDRFCNGDTSNDPPNAEPWGAPPTYRNFMGGDLQGIFDKLDYVGDLGISALYLTPIFKSSSNHKYDTIDYFTIDEHFGDLALLRRLVDACHARGIRVILDAVFNHCSNLHPYFLDVKQKGRGSRYWNWFFIKKWPIPDRFARHKDALEWYECWWGFHSLPKLNYTNPEVEEYFLKVAQYWLREAHTDGWRLDVPNEVIQTFWPKFRRAVRDVNPEAYIVGEIWDDATPWLMGDQFDAVMNYRFQKALLGYFAEETLDTKGLDQTLRQLMLDYPEQTTAVMLNLLGSHDTARPMTVVKGDVHSLKLMAALQFTFEGAPCIYYGDEIGLEGGKDPDCRRCYPWQKPELQNRELFAYYQRLIAIRKANPALRTGTFHPFVVDNDRELYAYERRADGNRCIVALNRSESSQTVKLPARVAATELLSGRRVKGDEVVVPERQAAILRVET
ncbi:MAG: glycoside hydrolase family 13 protein [Verrucomicrobiia bacterium]